MLATTKTQQAAAHAYGFLRDMFCRAPTDNLAAKFWFGGQQNRQAKVRVDCWDDTFCIQPGGPSCDSFLQHLATHHHLSDILRMGGAYLPRAPTALASIGITPTCRAFRCWGIRAVRRRACQYGSPYLTRGHGIFLHYARFTFLHAGIRYCPRSLTGIPFGVALPTIDAVVWATTVARHTCLGVPLLLPRYQPLPFFHRRTSGASNSSPPHGRRCSTCAPVLTYSSPPPHLAAPPSPLLPRLPLRMFFTDGRYVARYAL